MSVDELEIGVRRILAPNPGPWTLEGTNTYLLGLERVTVLDPGPASAEHLDAIMAAAPRIDRILLTHRHRDHAESAEALADRLGVDVAEPGDGERLELEVGMLLTIATPGHSSDHRCFMLEPTAALFSGDHVLGRGTTVVAYPDGDMSQYLTSLEAVTRAGPSVIYPGHGPTVSDPRAVLEAYRTHRLARETKVLTALGGTPLSVEEILARAYDDVVPAVLPAAELSLRAHLHKLANERLAVETEDGWKRT